MFLQPVIVWSEALIVVHGQVFAEFFQMVEFISVVFQPHFII